MILFLRAIIFMFLMSVGLIYLPFLASDRQSFCFSSWSIPNVRLKDHTLFFDQGFYSLISIKIDLPAQDDRSEYHFVYSRTKDFCTWTEPNMALSFGDEGYADESYIWTPFVLQEDDTFYMFYTGVNRHIAQSIMLATSTHPADPQSWVKQGVVFRPHHEGMIYNGSDDWSDGRDAMIFPYHDKYLMYYTGRDVSGGIIGLAEADTLTGPWHDLGATIQTPPLIMPESPFVVEYQGWFYLFSNNSGQSETWPTGEVWQWATSPYGPWHPPTKISPGWAHELYFDGSQWLSSYLIGNGESIGIAPVQWDSTTTPPSPVIGKE